MKTKIIMLGNEKCNYWLFMGIMSTVIFAKYPVMWIASLF